MLCNLHHYLILELFHRPQNKPFARYQPLPVPPPLNPWPPLIYFLSQWICLFWTFPKMASYNPWPFVTGFFH